MPGETSLPTAYECRLPVGAEVIPGGGVSFRVWAPDRQQVAVVWQGGDRAEGAQRPLVELVRENASGYFSGVAADAAAGDLYRFRLDGPDGGSAFPDPASRFQPEGPHGPSQVVDPAAFRWSAAESAWHGAQRAGQVIYELHIGTCTPAGTWAAAEGLLPDLADLGVTMLEVMPVAEFAGGFGWGYDGVDLFAPYHVYGDPDDFRRFVDRAHGLGLGVILDVVYNHFGPDGNYLKEFAAAYFTSLHANEWGEAIHYGPPEVRELFIANAVHWIAEYHLDGLRFDATQDIHDLSDDHILAAIGRAARAAGAELPPGRSVFLVAESEPQDSRLVRPPEQGGGYGLDAVWSDDFHHTARVALTGRAEAYYSDFQGSPRELLAATRYGPLFQGQRYAWQQKRRGVPAAGVPRAAFVTYLENHDQVANSARGARLHQLSSPGAHRALTALLLLGPGTPMLFQGQESGAAEPWVFFADHHAELAAAVARGRRAFLSQFPSVTGEVAQRIPSPETPEAFAQCRVAPVRSAAIGSAGSAGSAGAAEDREHRRRLAALALHRDLLRLRRTDPVIRLQGEAGLDGAVVGPQAFVVRFLAPATPATPADAAEPVAGAEPAAGDRLLVVNLGRDLRLESLAEPLLAPPAGCAWQMVWSSEHPDYGGQGAPPAEDGAGCWQLAGQAAALLRAAPEPPAPAARGPEAEGKQMLGKPQEVEG